MSSYQEVVVPTNVALITTTSIGRIPPSSTLVYNEKHKILNRLNFKRRS